MKHLIIPVIIALGLGACGESSDSGSGEPTLPQVDEHVWKEQTDALQKARDAEKLLKEAQAERQQQLDDATPPR